MGIREIDLYIYLNVRIIECATCTCFGGFGMEFENKIKQTGNSKPETVVDLLNKWLLMCCDLRLTGTNTAL